ncbi:hypothetical protein EP837_02828 [Sphingobium sp. EP60837]|nr:hypothetical protein EP837_02828 [Sphingobium sp. EP60837]
MTVTRCIEEGLVGGEGFAVDASLIKAEANRQRGVPGEEGLPPDIGNHAAREYLEVLDAAAFGAASPVTPKYLSPVDPAARWTSAHGGQAFFAYSTNYLIDLENAVIVDVEATTAIRPAEVTAQRPMIDRTQERFGIWPQRLAADTGNGDAANIAWLVHERGIEPHIPIFDHAGRRTGSYHRTEFRYDHQNDLYVCPGGKELFPRRKNYAIPPPDVDQDGFIRYRASKHDCDACALKPQCCPGQPNRKVIRSIHEGARDLARDLSKTDAYVTSRRERKRFRCCSPTSNASSSSTACACEDQMVQKTSSSWQPRHKTSVNWQSSYRSIQQPVPHEAASSFTPKSANENPGLLQHYRSRSAGKADCRQLGIENLALSDR